MKRITEREAEIIGNLLFERANQLTEMACGNWAKDPTEEESAAWSAESNDLYRIARRITMADTGRWGHAPWWYDGYQPKKKYL